jgi:hypothetical protein
MSYTYWLHEKIQKDLNEGFTWYEERRTGLGYEFLQAVENTISEIIAHPEVLEVKKCKLQGGINKKISLCNSL